MRVALISTGGTIEKTYDALKGALTNQLSVLDVMLSQLELHGLDLVRIPLMNKDSLDMVPADHALIARTALAMAEAYDGVIVVHGTDRLQVSGERTCTMAQGILNVPIIFTGAMKPYELRSSDALQNITEALLAVQLLKSGVYLVMHNQVLTFPGVIKDTRRGLFVRAEDLAEDPL